MKSNFRRVVSPKSIIRIPEDPSASNIFGLAGILIDSDKIHQYNDFS